MEINWTLRIFGRKLGRIFFEHKPGWSFEIAGKKGRVGGSWVAVLDFGPGAGYVGGATVYLGRNVSGSNIVERLRFIFGAKASGEHDYSAFYYRPVPIWFGVTRNGNAIPYVRH